MKKLFLLFVLPIIFSSCVTPEERKDEAAEKAREFIFDNVYHISQENYYYIKYTYPKILKNNIFLTQGQEYNQYYFAWDLPNPKITVLVYGTSRNNYREWEPLRLVFKKYKSSDYIKATETTGTWANRPKWDNAFYDLGSREVKKPDNIGSYD